MPEIQPKVPETPVQTPFPVSPKLPQEDVPKRFQPSKTTLFIDRFMTQFIKIGGLSVITAVFLIFIFILWQVIPLFRGAVVSELGSRQLPSKKYLAVGIDEWSELPLVIDSQGTVSFVDLAGKNQIQTADPGFAENKTISTFHYDQAQQSIVFGTSDGHFSVAKVNYSTNFAGGHRIVTQNLKSGPFYEMGRVGYPILNIDYADADELKLAAAIQMVNGKPEVHTETLIQEHSLMGAGEVSVGHDFDLTSQIKGEPDRVAVNSAANEVIVSTKSGDVCYFVVGDQATLRQIFKPFGDLKDPRIASMDYLLGGVSLVFTGSGGQNRVFSLYEKAAGESRTFGQTKEFPALPGPANFYASSMRNKAFLIGSGSMASLRYSTTEAIRWQAKLPFDVDQGILSGKYDRILLLDRSSKLHIYKLSDPHPEASFRALFGKIWYEGASEPRYEWQSTGASDDFEPKLSMVPLIFGTVKGTIYAMLFALPIAILAAVYTSQFLHPSFRIIVKPTMEIMASLPSVVLGFLAALWLAPILETRVPSVIVMSILVPAIALLFGWAWSMLPIQIRVLIKPGYEWIVFLPILIVAAYVSWQLGPSIEKILFVVKDPSTGKMVGDFRLWWPEVTHTPFEQRNSLVVGFMMGFAVIPIIFTIAEDALSNVPAALRSGSLALGASRWQTALRIVLPTASAGIFSAVMIGLGRAVGETLIVVMATGNTPIMSFNIFSGMRTLSANIAVELPEAPVAGTLYRTLFLGGLVLFILTFIVNTIAELMRQRLREKYKTV
jgi:phosphate transport system permease protein